MISGIVEIVRYRELVLSLIRRDLKRRYKGSILGFLWYLVNPLLIMGILWVVFGFFFSRMGGVEAYAVYLLSALVAWNFFTQSVLTSATNLATSGGLIRRVYVPKAVFPLASIGGSAVNFVLSLIPLSFVIWAYQRPVGWSLLYFPVGLLFLLAFSTGMALLISSINVFFRDVQHIAEVVFLAWFYATPVIWPVGMLEGLDVPAYMTVLLDWNPMAALIECLRAPIYSGTMPSAHALNLAGASALGLLLVGMAVFRRLESRFIYHL
ncbi:MAG: ABC transporter permease [Planctomycetota bacterium]|nr:ABC transporter permease [Planctomycetota bacterium]